MIVGEKIYLASDHAGLTLKNAIKKTLYAEGRLIEDLGTNSKDSVDYPDLAHYLAKKLSKGEATRGILVCGTGIGMSIAANRHPGVRAAVVSDVFSARMSRLHNDANVLCLGERVVTPEIADEIVKTWLDTAFEGGRHQKRIKKIERE